MKSDRLVLRTVSGKKGKGREFEVRLHSVMAVAPHPAAPGVVKPCWISFYGTPAECSPVAANIRLGCRAEVIDGFRSVASLAIAKSDAWRSDVQELPGGARSVTLCAPDLFDLDARVDGARFVFAPPAWWARREAENDDAESAVAALFAAHLDRRSDLPILTDPLFHRRLWRAAGNASWVHRPKSSARSPGKFFAYPERPDGFETVRFVAASSRMLRNFIEDQTRAHRLGIEDRGALRAA